VSGAEERIANDPASELWGEHRARYAFARQLPLSGTIVLDVACGSGFGLEMLSAVGARTIGVDYAALALWQIRRNLPEAALVNADATRLPLRSASVDHVVSFETIEHVPDARALIQELRRVLRPGGRLVLSTPNREFGPPERHTGNPFHIREFSAVELRALLHECFAEVELFGQRPRPEYRYVPFLMVERHYEPSALTWKATLRLPFPVRNRIAHVVSGRPFYPGETDYCFEQEATQHSHALVAVAK
jgi:ubiquinone/menaquinone biosynthesis C-methylase UbiE